MTGEQVVWAVVVNAFLVLVLWPFIKDGWKSVWCSWRTTVWVYGMCYDRVARRNVGTGEVQHIIWKAGEQGHKVDNWIRFDSSWYKGFIPWED